MRVSPAARLGFTQISTDAAALKHGFPRILAGWRRPDRFVGCARGQEKRNGSKPPSPAGRGRGRGHLRLVYSTRIHTDAAALKHGFPRILAGRRRPDRFVGCARGREKRNGSNPPSPVGRGRGRGHLPLLLINTNTHEYRCAKARMYTDFGRLAPPRPVRGLCPRAGETHGVESPLPCGEGPGEGSPTARLFNTDTHRCRCAKARIIADYGRLAPPWPVRGLCPRAGETQRVEYPSPAGRGRGRGHLPHLLINTNTHECRCAKARIPTDFGWLAPPRPVRGLCPRAGETQRVEAPLPCGEGPGEGRPILYLPSHANPQPWHKRNR